MGFWEMQFFSANLNEAQQLVISEVFSLAVDQEVAELRGRQAEYSERGVLYPRAVTHDAGRCYGVRDLLLVVRQRLPGADEEAHIRAVSCQEVYRDTERTFVIRHNEEAANNAQVVIKTN